jgi:molybdopterin converting factor small subunit
VKVTVRLFATFRDLLPQHGVSSSLGIDVDEHETVQGLINTLSLPAEVPRIILVNGLFTSEDSHLHEGDIVSIFPPLIGGIAGGVSSAAKGRPIPLLRASLQE